MEGHMKQASLIVVLVGLAFGCKQGHPIAESGSKPVQPTTQPIIKGSTRQKIESDYVKRIGELERKLEPEYKKLIKDMDAGQWDSAKERLDLIKEAWKGEAFQPLSLPGLEAEIYIGMGQPKLASQVLNQHNPIVKADEGLTGALISAMQGDIHSTKVKTLIAKKLGTWKGLSEEEKDKLESEPVAAVRLARASNFWFEANTTRCEREAREVLQYLPEEPLAAYLVAQCLTLKGEWDESKPYWKLAAKLGGPEGAKAKLSAGIEPEERVVEGGP